MRNKIWRMKPNAIEIGERYGDDSGWERRVMVNRQEGRFEIDLNGSHLSAHPRDIEWLIEALQKAHGAVFGA